MINKERYRQQIKIPTVGLDGQEKINRAKVLVIGAGGLGHPVLSYLVASGIGHLGICDFDLVDISNLQRQVFFKEVDIGQPKVEIIAQRLKELNSMVSITSYFVKVSTQNILEIFSSYDFVVDCTDNFNTKFLIHDTCLLLGKKLVQGSVYQNEGILHSFDFSSKENLPCWRCLWAREPEELCIKNCMDSGIFGPAVGTIGSLMAMDVLNLIVERATNVHLSRTFDLQTFETIKVRWRKNSKCECCQDIQKFYNDHYGHNLDNQLEVFVLPKGLFQIIDIRSDESAMKTSIAQKYHVVRASMFPFDENIIEKERINIIVCETGKMSLRLCRILREKGFKNVYSYGASVKELM